MGMACAQRLLLEAHLAQRMEPARGDGEVDGAPGAHRLAPHVRPPLQHLHLEAAAGQVHGASSEPTRPAPTTVTGVFGLNLVHARSSTSTKRNTSRKRLYSGAGAARMTSGSRKSQMTPAVVEHLQQSAWARA